MTDILRQLSEPRRRQQPGTEKSQTVPKGDILVQWARKCSIEPGQNENIYYLLTISILLNALGALHFTKGLRVVNLLVPKYY